MKYFTRALIEMGRSRDYNVLNQQEELWDQACERYFTQLDSLKDQMPSGLRTLVEGYYLHDAAVRGMGQQGSTFVIVLQLDTPPQSLLTLTYNLVTEPVLDRGALPAESLADGGPVEWQHDEIERAEGEPSAWQQSILLSNGWEVQLRFRDVAVQEVAALIPVPRNGHVGTTSPAVPQGI